jgi:hypothetical protein
MNFGTPEYDDLLLEILTKEKRHDLYKTTVETYNRMRIHIYGDKPTDILKRTRPREPEEITTYRLDNYEPTTKATSSKALSVVSKIFNPTLFQISWKDQTNNGKKLQDFTLQYFPKHNSVLKLLSQAGLKRMIADPNGVFAIRPKSMPESDTIPVEPEIKIYGSPVIWYYDQDHFLIHLKTEETKQGARYYFEYYDDRNVINFTAIAINQKQIFIEELFRYEHNFGEIPVWFLTGETETEDNGSEYYISFFDAAVPFWNKAITHESDLDAAFIMHLHPQKVVTAEDCAFVLEDQRCQGGHIQFPDGKTKVCPSCQGSGKRIPVGPFGVHMVAKEKLDIGQQMNAPVQYVTVPTDPTKMLVERVEQQHRKGLEALNMDIIDDVGENQSGIAKVIDRGELYDFLAKIADVVFDTHLQNFFHFINMYQYGLQDTNPGRDLNSNLPDINKPVVFDLSSVPEKTIEYKASKEASVNPEYLRQKQISLASKEYGNAPDIKRKIVTSLELDPLPEITPADMEIKLMSGTISKQDAVIHDNIGPFVDKATQEHKDFYIMEKSAKLEIIQKYATEFIAKNRVTLTKPDDTGAASAAA